MDRSMQQGWDGTVKPNDAVPLSETKPQGTLLAIAKEEQHDGEDEDTIGVAEVTQTKTPPAEEADEDMPDYTGTDAP